MLRNINNTLAPPPSIKTETQSATNNSETLKTPHYDFKPSMTQNYVYDVRNDEKFSSKMGLDNTCVFQLQSGVKKSKNILTF